jgi:hypothetical protein
MWVHGSVNTYSRSQFMAVWTLTVDASSWQCERLPVDVSSWQCEHLQQMPVHGIVNTYSRSQFMAVWTLISGASSWQCEHLHKEPVHGSVNTFYLNNILLCIIHNRIRQQAISLYKPSSFWRSVNTYIRSQFMAVWTLISRASSWQCKHLQ